MDWLIAALFSAVVLGVAMTCVAYLTWIERKVAARFQNRIGPYWVGYPHGWLQPLADVAKLIVKEDITPRDADRVLFNLAPLLVVGPALLGFVFWLCVFHGLFFPPRLRAGMKRGTSRQYRSYSSPNRSFSSRSSSSTTRYMTGM